MEILLGWRCSLTWKPFILINLVGVDGALGAQNAGCWDAQDCTLTIDIDAISFVHDCGFGNAGNPETPEGVHEA